MVTAVVLTYNEESRIASCLKCIKWCSQIVVVDMSSSDATVKIAKSLGAEVIVVEKIENFDLLRNYGIVQANYEWILTVDADELVPFCLASWIIDELKEPSHDVYKFARLNYILGEPMKGNGVWPDYQIKLFRKGSLEFKGTVHNFIRVFESSRVVKIPCWNDNMCLHHFTTNSLNSFFNKLLKYTELQSNELSSNKNLILVFLQEFLFRFIRAKGYRDKGGFNYSFLLSIYKVVLHMRPQYKKVYDYNLEIQAVINSHG